MTATSHRGSCRRIVDGVSLTEYSSAGAYHGAPLVFVHGGCHGAWMWSGMQLWFAERGWNSSALDWYSHGDSEKLPVSEWVRRGIRWVGEEIGIACSEADRRPVLIGHSMGGLASLLYALPNPGALSALVLLTPVVPRRFAAAPIEIPVDMHSPWPAPPPETARTLLYSGVDDETAAALYAKLQPVSPTAVREATRWTIDVEVASLRIPTLVVAAELDPLTPAEYVLALGSRLGASTLCLPRAGHGVTLDPGWPDLAAWITSWHATI